MGPSNQAFLKIHLGCLQELLSPVQALMGILPQYLMWDLLVLFCQQEIQPWQCHQPEFWSLWIAYLGNHQA